MEIRFSADDFELIKINAKKSEIGGRSAVRGDDRASSLSIDQLIGQIGSAAGSMFLYGSLFPYQLAREKANANPFSGDDGYDLPAIQCDFKASLWRYKNKPIMDHVLAVRPRERHAGWKYCSGIVTELLDDTATIDLVGWLYDYELPQEPNGSGCFDGAFTVLNRDLRGMDCLREEIFALASF